MSRCWPWFLICLLGAVTSSLAAGPGWPAPNCCNHPEPSRHREIAVHVRRRLGSCKLPCCFKESLRSSRSPPWASSPPLFLSGTRSSGMSRLVLLLRRAWNCFRWSVKLPPPCVCLLLPGFPSAVGNSCVFTGSNQPVLLWPVSARAAFPEELHAGQCGRRHLVQGGIQTV